MRRHTVHTRHPRYHIPRYDRGSGISRQVYATQDITEEPPTRKGRWVTFPHGSGSYINHYFADGFQNKDSKALCGHDAKRPHKENFWGYVPDCAECKEKLNKQREMETTEIETFTGVNHQVTIIKGERKNIEKLFAELKSGYNPCVSSQITLDGTEAKFFTLKDSYQTDNLLGKIRAHGFKIKGTF